MNDAKHIPQNARAVAQDSSRVRRTGVSDKGAHTPITQGSSRPQQSAGSSRDAHAVAQDSSRVRRLVFSGVFALSAAVMAVWGDALSRIGRLESPQFVPSDALVAVAVFAAFFAATYALLAWGDRRDNTALGGVSSGAHSKQSDSAAHSKSASVGHETPKSKAHEAATTAARATTPALLPFSRKRFLATWAAVFCVWIPVLLAYWPTIWAYDVYDQVPLETGGVFYAHHPLLHTLIIQGCISLGKIISGGYELGMVLLSVLQMTAMSGIFAWAVEKIRQEDVPAPAAYALLAFFSLMPFNPILAISQTKDVLFSGLFLVLFLLHRRALTNPGSLVPKDWLALGVVTVLLLMFRHNAVYALGVWIVLSVVLPGRKDRELLTLVSVAGLLVSLVLSMSLHIGLRAASGEPEEAYSVPIQTLTRIASLHDEYVVPYGKKLKMFDGLVLRDEFPKKFSIIYKPANADGPKGAWERSDERTGSFDNVGLIREWITLSAKYPADSVVAWSLLTKGAWYPLDTSHAHVYDGDTFLLRPGYLTTDYMRFQGMFQQRPQSKFPALEALLEKIATGNVHHKNPLTAIPLAPATYLWVLLLLLCAALYRKNSILPLLLVFLYWGTVLLGPLILVRYMYPIMLIAPTALVLAVGSQAEKLTVNNVA